MYPMELCHVSKKQAMTDARQLAKLVSLSKNLHDRFPQKLSGGEQQRVAIARALAMNRQLILADEPTGSLDSENSAMIIDLLSELTHKEGKCVIVVTHDFCIMEKANIIYHIVDGCLKEYNGL
jgi:ABC-type lipoprotein export system ATPase subunit